MNCSIISIGTELSLGLITDSNSAFIAEKLSEMGIECNYMFTVPDSRTGICNALKHGLKYSDIIITSGGLGPTDDDMTRRAAADTLGRKLVRIKDLDPTSLKFIRKKRTRDINHRLLRQSYIPEGARPIKPRIGSASGFRVDLEDGKYLFCIPGVPKEMKSMFEDDIIPFLNKKSGAGKGKGQGKKIRKSTLLTTDISETEIEESIKDLVAEARRESIQIGITASPGLIKIILVQKAGNGAEEDRLKSFEDKICQRLGGHVYGRGKSLISDNLKSAVEGARREITISAAESITGGLISSIITDTPGSSGFFRGGIVSYSDFAKEKVLGISRDLIRTQGAVSMDVCIQMAEKAMTVFKTDYSIAVTGFAGPDSEDNRLGLVFCCIKGSSGYQKVFEKRFLGNRNEIKFRTAQFVLNELRNAIMEEG